MKEILTYSL